MEPSDQSKQNHAVDDMPSASELSLSDSSHEDEVAIARVDLAMLSMTEEEEHPFDEEKHDEGKGEDPFEEEQVDDGILANQEQPPLPSALPRYRPSRDSAGALQHHFVAAGHVIGPAVLTEMASCPCCQQRLDGKSKTLNEPTQVAHNHRGSLLSQSSDEEEDELEDDDTLEGVLAKGVHYSTKRVLVEGWLHKKGTGQDWLGSRAWKPRWARLVEAKVDGYDCDVPLLLIFWYPSSAAASTAIVLESTVVLKVDLEDKERWNSYRFEIRHVSTASSSMDEEDQVARSFTAPQKARDAWVYAISQALLSFEKLKAKARQRQAASMETTATTTKSSLYLHDLVVPHHYSHDRPGSPNSFDEMAWTGDRFVRAEVRPPLSPPSSPPAVKHHKHYLKGRSSPPIPPRPKGRSMPQQHKAVPPLAGESIQLD